MNLELKATYNANILAINGKREPNQPQEVIEPFRQKLERDELTIKSFHKEETS